MNILVLAPLNPLKQITGMQRRLWNLWSYIARFHDVTMLCYDFEIKQIIYKKENGLKMYLFPIDKTYLKIHENENNPFLKIKRLMYAALHGLPSSLHAFNQDAVQTLIYSLHDKENFKLIVSDHLLVSVTLLKTRSRLKIPSLFISHGFEWDTFERLSSLDKNWFRTFFWNFFNRNLKAYELSVFKKTDYCCCISSEEKDILLKNGVSGDRIEVIPNGVDCDFFAPVRFEKQSKEKVIVFLGPLDYPPNLDAVRVYLSKMHPVMMEKFPELKFYIVGKEPPLWLKEASQREGSIVVTGYVDDVRKYLTMANVCIAPIRAGGGSRLKILEYMAMSKPVVSTTIGAEGIDVTPEENILIADEDDKFIRSMIEILSNPELAEQIGTNARRLVEDRYDWNTIGEKFRHFLEGIET